MKKFVLFPLWLLSLCLSAQSEIIINHTTLLIAEGKYNDAEKYLDSLIIDDPKRIDALMMKGNVLLNYALMETPALNKITLQDESIYSEDLATLATPVVLVPRDRVPKIVELWTRCIVIDPGRLDIQKGLCSLYGMADMKKELLEYMPIIAKSAKDKGDEFAYTLTDYAQLMEDRGDRDGAYAVIKKAAELYPHVSGIWCVLSETYFDAGDLTSAKLYADRGLSASEPDLVVCGDALDVYIALHQQDRVLAALKVASRDTAFKDYPFFEGMYQYAHHETGWKKDVTAYMQQFPVAPDSNAIYSTAQFMLSPYFTDDYTGFINLMHYSLTDFCIGLVLERACHDFKDSVQPFMLSAQACVNNRNYSEANAIFAALEKKNISGDARLDYLLQYAYALYCAEDYPRAISKWEEVAKINIPFFFSASNYFLGRSYLKSGQKDKAIEYFRKLVDSKDETKYAYLANLNLEKIGK